MYNVVYTVHIPPIGGKQLAGQIRKYRYLHPYFNVSDAEVWDAIVYDYLCGMWTIYSSKRTYSLPLKAPPWKVGECFWVEDYNNSHDLRFKKVIRVKGEIARLVNDPIVEGLRDYYHACKQEEREEFKSYWWWTQL